MPLSLAMLDSLRGRGYKQRLQHPVDAWWDFRLGVNTFGYVPAVGDTQQRDWRAHYTPTPYGRVLSTLRHVGVGPDDVVVDFGCGLGRAVFCASWLGARKAVGVEIDAGLARQARENHRRSRLAGRPIEFACMPAQDFIASDATVVFMFHPFGPGTLSDVIDRLRDEVRRRPRPLRVVYENPVYASVLDEAGWLQRIDAWPKPRIGGDYPAMFWQAAA